MRKGELSKSAIDNGWPHQVVIPASDVQGAGYAPRYTFAESMSLCRRGHSFRRDDRDFIVMCFAQKADAERYIPRVGGAYTTPGAR